MMLKMIIFIGNLLEKA